MKPWREEASEAGNDEGGSDIGNLLAQAAGTPAWTVSGKGAVWERLEASAAGSGRAFWSRVGWELPLALAGSMALLVFALVHTRAPSEPLTDSSHAAAPVIAQSSVTASDWIAVDLGAVGRLRVRPATNYRLPAAGTSEYRIALQEGELCAEIEHRDPATQAPLLVETSQMRVFVVGTSFCVEVRGGLSQVSVTQGRVRVQTASGTAFVGAGETISSNDPRLNESSIVPPASMPARASARPSLPLAESAARASGERTQVAAPAPQPTLPPSSLAAQNALFAQGAQARDRHDGPGALAAWRSYLNRFPQGVLAPEASAGVLTELVTEGRDGEALIAANEYLGSFPADGRAAEVAFIRGNLLHDKLGRTADALAAYRDALALATRPRLRDDALFAVGACERMLGRTAEAQETFKRYQAEFPNGAHAAELSKWQAP